MGYLLSLSEATTSVALDVSEIVLLISGLLLLFGAVGEYLFDHDRLPRWMRWPKLTFEIIVALSLGGELIADGGVAVFSHVLQRMEGADIQALDKKAQGASDKAEETSHRADALALTIQHEQEQADKLADRMGALSTRLNRQEPRWRLLQVALPDIVARLKPFAGQSADVVACGSQSVASGELRRTHQVIFSALRERALWKLNIHTGEPPPFWDGCSPATVPGILILIAPNALPSARSAATELSSVLRGVIPSSVAKTMPMAVPPFPPGGPTHPYNFLVGHPELIVVLVGENTEQ